MITHIASCEKIHCISLAKPTWCTAFLINTHPLEEATMELIPWEETPLCFSLIWFNLISWHKIAVLLTAHRKNFTILPLVGWKINLSSLEPWTVNYDASDARLLARESTCSLRKWKGATRLATTIKWNYVIIPPFKCWWIVNRKRKRQSDYDETEVDVRDERTFPVSPQSVIAMCLSVCHFPPPTLLRAACRRGEK